MRRHAGVHRDEERFRLVDADVDARPDRKLERLAGRRAVGRPAADEQRRLVDERLDAQRAVVRQHVVVEVDVVAIVDVLDPDRI